jgi:hypothetical protein
MGTSEAIEEHPGHGCARCERLLLLGHAVCVDPIYQTSVFDDRSNQPQVIQTFDADRYHRYPAPESQSVVQQNISRRVTGFFSFCTCSMSAKSVNQMHIY